MSVDRLEYRDLALTVERGKVGNPSVVTLDWVTVDDEGREHDRGFRGGLFTFTDGSKRKCNYFAKCVDTAPRLL